MAEAGRRGRLIPLLYYYLATVVGLTITLIGLIGGLHGLVTAALPQISDEVRFAVRPVEHESPGGTTPQTEEEKARIRADAEERARLGGFADALRGMVTAGVGAPVFFWHLRQARRREFSAGAPAPPDPAGG